MPSEELNRVHRRYIVLSGHFKSAWTFHQFIQGVRKVFVDQGPAEYTADFQTVYGNLKPIGANLSEATLEMIKPQLDAVERGLEPLIAVLRQADTEVSPTLLRQFFQRVKSYDDNILTQLVKFYLYFHDARSWDRDHLDKADFLSTKLAEEYDEARDQFVLRDRMHLADVAKGFWAALGAPQTESVAVDEACRKVVALRREIVGIGSIDELNEKGVVQRYRDFKHGLGALYFEPSVYQDIVETNLVFKNYVQRIYDQDEQRIVAEYQRVFELERDVDDTSLVGELTEFRSVVDRFEKQLESNNVRLEDLASLRDKVRDLLPQMEPDPKTGKIRLVDPSQVRLGPGAVATVRPTSLGGGESMPEDLEKAYRDITRALDDTNIMEDPKRIAARPEIYGLRIEPREIVAYRRLNNDETCDRELEDFLLRSAAARLRIEREVEEIKGILDESMITGEAAVSASAHVTVRESDLYLRRFDHFVERTLLDHGNIKEGRALQVSRMRLLRAYAGLWLMVYKESYR